MPVAVHEPENTTHYSVVDPEGNAVAVTTTLNDSFGSHVTAEGLGFLLNDEMDDFASKQGVAEHLRTDSRSGQCDRPRQASAFGDDADDRAQRRQAVSGARLAWRPAQSSLRSPMFLWELSISGSIFRRQLMLRAFIISGCPIELLSKTASLRIQ